MNYALVLAGGVGSRMGADIPKQFIEVGGKPIIVYSLEAFSTHSEIDGIFVVCIEEWQERLKEDIKRFSVEKILGVLPQGRDRRESSYIGVNAVWDYVLCEEKESSDTVVLIHDAARPLVTRDIISRNIADAKKYGGCETVCSMNDTVVKSIDGMAHGITDIVPRKELFRVQTPQSFVLKEIKAAHDAYGKIAEKSGAPEITDDAGLMLYVGKSVKLTEGSGLNIKVTSKDDLVLAEAVLTR